MNWKPTIIKIVLSIILGVILGRLYSVSNAVSYNAQTASFVIGVVTVFLIVYVVYSLIQKDKKK